MAGNTFHYFSQAIILFLCTVLSCGTSHKTAEIKDSSDDQEIILQDMAENEESGISPDMQEIAETDSEQVIETLSSEDIFEDIAFNDQDTEDQDAEDMEEEIPDIMEAEEDCLQTDNDQPDNFADEFMTCEKGDVFE
jgi:hypothetical protein